MRLVNKENEKNKLLMMNIRNLGSKESTGVKFKQSICAKLYLQLWFESDCNIFVILLSQDGFKSNSPERKS